jgi:hypothetical protein
MPNFKNSNFFAQNSSPPFDAQHHPGQTTPASGIYRCTSCGFEATCVMGKPLPPENACHLHSSKWKATGKVQW